MLMHNCDKGKLRWYRKNGDFLSKEHKHKQKLNLCFYSTYTYTHGSQVEVCMVVGNPMGMGIP